MKDRIEGNGLDAIQDTETSPRPRARRRAGLAVLGVLCPLSLLLLAPAASADTVTCTATSGYWRWGGGPGLDLSGSPAGSSTGNTYLDALRATENFRTGADPDASSRAALDATMDRRFTTGPQPWGTAYADKRAVGLANFRSTTGSLGGFSLGAACVPADATINSAKVRVTHAIIDPNDRHSATYAARIRVNPGVGNTFTAFDLLGNNLVGGGSPVPAASMGIAHEVSTDTGRGGAGDLDVTPVLGTAAAVNGAVIQFQANRAGSGAAMRTPLNEISLIVDYTGGTPPPPGDGLTKLVTGGGFIDAGTASGGKANFGFNARSFHSGPGAPATGNFEYNDGRMQVKGSVDNIGNCSSFGGRNGSFEFSGTYTARDGKGPRTLSGTFTASVVDNGEPGKGVDTIALSLSPSIGGFVGFGQTTLGGGNIQYHFCDLP